MSDVTNLALPASFDLGSHANRLSRSLHSGPVAAALREAIISGALPAGTQLVERSLAEQLNVSRGPVRNALYVLEGEGLVQTGSNGRTVARGFSPRDVADLLSVRWVLESTAIRWSVTGGSQVGEAEQILAEMQAEGTSNQNLVNLDVMFHLALVESARSRFLVQSWQAIAPVIHTVITIGNRSLASRDPISNFNRIIESHQRIIDPLRAGAADLAVERLSEQFAVTEFMLNPETD